LNIEYYPLSPSKVTEYRDQLMTAKFFADMNTETFFQFSHFSRLS